MQRVAHHEHCAVSEELGVLITPLERDAEEIAGHLGLDGGGGGGESFLRVHWVAVPEALRARRVNRRRRRRRSVVRGGAHAQGGGRGGGGCGLAQRHKPANRREHLRAAERSARGAGRALSDHHRGLLGASILMTEIYLHHGPF
jgi:hypothetical protein